MSIADKLTIIAENVSKVYESGYADANVLEYATNVARLFQNAAFPSGHEMVVKLPNCPTSIQEMFRTSYGLRKLTMDIPTNKAYNGQYFAFGSTSNHSTLEELVLPDGIKFSNFLNFVNNCYALEKINCGLGENGVGIDLSESTSNVSSFAQCRELVEVRFKKNTIKTNIGFTQSSKLSDKSIESIIDGLADLRGQTAQKVEFHTDVILKFTDEQLADIEAKNWTL